MQATAQRQQPANLAPFSVEAEEALIGGVMQYPEVLPEVVDIIRSPEMFWSKRHEYIWGAILQANADGALNFLTVNRKLEETGKKDECGGIPFLTYLANKSPIDRHVLVYAHVVERTHRRREFLKLSDTIRKQAMDESNNINEVTSAILDNIFKINDEAPRHRSRSAESVAQTVLQQMMDNSTLYNDNKQYMSGISTGFPTFDRHTDGLMPGYITTVAGPTGVGKTAFILNVIYHALLRGIRKQETKPANVVIFSGEMTEEDLVRRMVAMMTKINARRIRRGEFRYDSPEDIEQQKAVMNALKHYESFPLHFETGQRLKTTGLRASIRQYLAKGQLDLLVLDSILQVDADTHQQSKNDQDWLNITRTLEDLEEIAQEFQIPILATAQVGRSGYTGKPTLADLKRSSGIEEKSAVVALLHNSEEMDVNNNPIRKLTIAKNRHGQEFEVDLIFNGPLTRFYERAYEKEQ